jgi:hypothetical protein
VGVNVYPVWLKRILGSEKLTVGAVGPNPVPLMVTGVAWPEGRLAGTTEVIVVTGESASIVVSHTTPGFGGTVITHAVMGTFCTLVIALVGTV